MFDKRFIAIGRQVNRVMAQVAGFHLTDIAADNRGMDKIVIPLKVETYMMRSGRVIFKQPFGIIPFFRARVFF
jgi:hypothetical protein